MSRGKVHPMSRKSIIATQLVLLAVLAGSSVVPGAQGQSTEANQEPGTPSPKTPAAKSPAQSAAPVQTQESESQNPAPSAQPATAGNQHRTLKHTSQHAAMYYEAMWGVDSLRVKLAESGELVRFDYRVLDPEKASALNDKKAEPELIDPQAGVKLVVPQMEKVGKLRQSSTPKAGMVYWMAFSNPTRAVKRGDRVDVVIGPFRASNLIVE
jgi:hypothetical protein